MSYVYVAIIALACIGIGIAVAVLWNRRYLGIVKGEIRARVEHSLQDQIQQEQSRNDVEALDQLRRNFGEGEQK